MQEIHLEKNTLITSKTNLKGEVVYANADFLKYAGYKMEEILYKPHNRVRHEDMPKTVFKCLWDYVQSGKEIFAFVKNKAKNGNFYWVFANITPSFDENGNIISYYSVRRCPNQKAIPIVENLYKTLLQKEKEGGIKLGVETLMQVVSSHNVSYNEFVLNLQKNS